MLKSKLVLIVFTGVALMMSAAACGNKAKKEATANVRNEQPPSKDRPRTQTAQTAEVTGVDADGSEIRFRPVYFEFDSSDLTAEARDELAKMAAHFQKRKDMAVTIEGHADERGTTEYNLALGDRRARAIRDYLVRLGVAESRMSIISYGEERPAVSGEDEGAWVQNRRGEFVKR